MPRIDDYQNALALAREEWAKQDPQRAAILSGADYQAGPDGTRLQLPFMDKADHRNLAGGPSPGTGPGQRAFPAGTGLDPPLPA